MVAARHTLMQALDEYARTAGPDFAARVRRYLLAGGTQDDTALTRYIRVMEQGGLAPGTIDLHVRTIRAFYRHFNLRAPEAKGWVYDSDDADRPALEVAVIERIIETARGGALTGRQAALVALSTTYGLRAVELARMRDADMDLQGRRIYLRTAKGGKPRWCWLPPEIAAYLDRNWPATSANAVEASFGGIWAVAIGTPKPSRVAWHGIRRALVAAARAAGVPGEDVERFMRWSAGRGGRRMVELYANPNQVVGAGGTTRAPAQDMGSRDYDRGMWDAHPFLGFWVD